MHYQFLIFTIMVVFVLSYYLIILCTNVLLMLHSEALIVLRMFYYSHILRMWSVYVIVIAILLCLYTTNQLLLLF